MTDLDSLIVTFQTQLSDVMETVVKTAMYEVTRLVEDGFLEEIQRRNQEVESLRLQLQWTERKLNDQEGREGKKTGRCVDCVKDDVELSIDTAEERHQDDIMGGFGMKEEGDFVERWTISCTQEVVPESTQAADNPTSILSPERKSETTEENVLPVVDVKEEQAHKPSCSSVIWSGPLDGDLRPDSDGPTEKTDAQPKQTQEDSEELLRDVIKQDPQMSPSYDFPKDQEETHMATDPSLDVDSGWAGLPVNTAGLLQSHRLVTEQDCDPAKTRGPLKQAEHKLTNCVTADVDVLVTSGRDQISSSASPEASVQYSDALGVTIKQEVIDESEGYVENEPKEKKMTKSGVAFFSCSVKQHKVRSEAPKQNHISHKATAQEVVKVHSKASTGLRLQAAVQHLHRPIKKPPHTHLNSASAALSIAHSHVGNANLLNRTPSTSKVTPLPPLSVQRVHLGDKQATAHNRNGGPWVSIKTHQSVNSHHSNTSSHPDSHPHTGPRHLLRCFQCGKCFPHPSNLKAHLQTHTGERPFCCSLCGRSFTKLSNLKAHRRVHTGERPYCCLACGKRFTQKCNLKRHQRIHLDI